MVDPHNALLSLQDALKDGLVKMQPGALDHDLWFHLDYPNGKTRMTYAYMDAQTVTAFANLAPTDPFEEKPCFQIGYAVGEAYRGQGLAKKVVKSALAEVSNGLARNGSEGFFVEASVSVNNTPSLKVAEFIFGNPVHDGVDENTGENVKIFRMSFDQTEQ